MFQLIKTWNFFVKLGFLKNLYQIIDVYLHKGTIMNQLHIHVFINYFNFEAQIVYMQFVE
jgi:hypothetical protein